MSVFKSAYYCPFCHCAMVCTATNIVRHCKSRHGKTVKADDCQSPKAVKECDWTQPRKKLADKFKVKK